MTTHSIVVCRQITLKTTNRKPDKIISGGMFRLATERQQESLIPNQTFIGQEREIVKLLEASDISSASKEVYLGKNTIIPFR